MPENGSIDKRLDAVAESRMTDQGPDLVCPLCDAYQTTRSARGLMRHLTAMHVGCCIGERGAALLRGLHRGLCVRCGGLRAGDGRQCHQ